MLFGTAKRLNILHGAQLETTVNGSTINSTTDYKYLGVYLNSTLNLSTHFDKIYKKADGRVNLLRRIRSSIDMYSVEWIFNTMILPIFTYCGSVSLGWSDTRKQAIQNIERRSLKIIASKQSFHNLHLRTPLVDSLIKKRACSFVFDCLKGQVCSPFNNYFLGTDHQINTRNNNSFVQLP